MEIELQAVRDFLAEHPPFDHLDDGLLDELPARVSIRYLRRGTPVPPTDADGCYSYVVRKGAIEIHDDQQLVEKLGEGDCVDCHQQAHDTKLRTVTAEDTLIYLIPCAEIERLRERSKPFASYFTDDSGKRLRKALTAITDTFTNALENAVVELKKTAEGGIEVEITFDAETALAEIQNLADEFNTVVADVNRALHGNQAFAEDPDLNGVRQNLTDPNEPAAVEPAEKPAPPPEGVLKTFDRITPPVSGTPLADSGVLRFGDFFNSNTAQTIEKGVRPEPPTTGGLLIKQLEPVGIEIQPGDTVEINSTKLEEALKNGNENVQDIFFDSENGLLAFLKARLEPLLNEDFGPLPAGDESIQETQTPVQRGNARLRERLLDSLTENRQTRNLIAIV